MNPLEEKNRWYFSYDDRYTVAGRLLTDEKLTIPSIVDSMDNKVAENYEAHPNRIFLVRKDGRLGDSIYKVCDCYYKS